MSVEAGYMKGKTYYSDLVPQGEGKGSPYNPELYRLANHVYYNDTATKQDVFALQKMLVGIGYLDGRVSSSLDSLKGTNPENSMTLGATYRYMTNYAKEDVWNSVKDWFIWD